jgi:hypothetical protein
MRKVLLFSALLFAWPALAQQTPVSATVTSPNGIAYAFATGSASIVCPGNAQPTYNGYTVPRNITITGFDGFGFFSMVVYDVNALQPVGCAYTFAITAQDGIHSFTTGLIGGATQSPVITGNANVDLSAAISAYAVPLPLPASLTINVNSVPVTNPNFGDSPTLKWTVAGSTIQGTASGGGGGGGGSSVQIGGVGVGTPNFVNNGIFNFVLNGSTVTGTVNVPGIQGQVLSNGGGSPTLLQTGTLTDTPGVGISTTGRANVAGNAAIGGGGPWYDVTSSPYLASGSNQTTTGTISGGTNSLSLAGAIDLKNGQGIRVYHAGAATTLTTPASCAVTTQGVTGGTTYSYQVSALDTADGTNLGGGETASCTAVTTTTGNATLGGSVVATISSITRSGTTLTFVLSQHLTNLVAGNVVVVSHGAGGGDFTADGVYQVATSSDDEHFTVTYADRPYYGGGTLNLNGTGTVTLYNGNVVTWAAQSGVNRFAIWKGGTQTFVGMSPGGGTFYLDYGQAAPVDPDWLFGGAANPSVAQNDWLVTTIVSGGGTTTLTLNNNAVATVTGKPVHHDDTAAINAAMTASLASNLAWGPVFFPIGQYELGRIVIPSHTVPGGAGAWFKIILDGATLSQYGSWIPGNFVQLEGWGGGKAVSFSQNAASTIQNVVGGDVPIIFCSTCNGITLDGISTIGSNYFADTILFQGTPAGLGSSTISINKSSVVSPNSNPLGVPLRLTVDPTASSNALSGFGLVIDHSVLGPSNAAPFNPMAQSSIFIVNFGFVTITNTNFTTHGFQLTNPASSLAGYLKISNTLYESGLTDMVLASSGQAFTLNSARIADILNPISSLFVTGTNIYDVQINETAGNGLNPNSSAGVNGLYITTGTSTTITDLPTPTGGISWTRLSYEGQGSVAQGLFTLNALDSSHNAIYVKQGNIFLAGNLKSQGGVSCGFSVKSGNYTLTANDCVINVNSAATITIPHALTGTNATASWTVSNTTNSSIVTLQADSGTINGLSSVALTGNSTAIVHADGTNVEALFAGGGGGGGTVGNCATTGAFANYPNPGTTVACDTNLIDANSYLNAAEDVTAPALDESAATAGGTYNIGDLACLTASNTYASCGSAAANSQYVGVLRAKNGTLPEVAKTGTVLANSQSSATWTQNDIVCSDGTNSGKMVDNVAVHCQPPSVQVGLVKVTDGGSVTQHTITMTRGYDSTQVQIAGTPITEQTIVNFINDVADAGGVTFTNPSVGQVKGVLSNITGGGANTLACTLSGLAQGQVVGFNSTPICQNLYMGVNVNPQTGSYSLTCPGDRLGEVEFNISAPSTLTVPQAGSTTCFQSSIGFVIRNAISSTAVLTVTPTTSSFQPENVASKTILPGAGMFIYSDAVSGTGNYHAIDVPRFYGTVVSHAGNYTLTALDDSVLTVMNCSSACTATLPASPPTVHWTANILSIGGTTALVSLNGLHLNGGTTPPTMNSANVFHFWTDGSNYFGDSSFAAGGGGATLSGDGALICNSGSTSPITLVICSNTAGHKWWGVSSTGPTSAAFNTIGTADLPGSGATTVNGQTCTLGSTCQPVSAFATLTDGATVTWAIGSIGIANANLTFTVHSGSRTLNITNPVNGGSYVVWLKQDGTGGEGLTLGTGCTWKVANGGAGAVTLSSGANAIDVLAFTYDGTNCYATLGKNYN